MLAFFRCVAAPRVWNQLPTELQLCVPFNSAAQAQTENFSVFPHRTAENNIWTNWTPVPELQACSRSTTSRRWLTRVTNSASCVTGSTWCRSVQFSSSAVNTAQLLLLCRCGQVRRSACVGWCRLATCRARPASQSTWVCSSSTSGSHWSPSWSSSPSSASSTNDR